MADKNLLQVGKPDELGDFLGFEAEEESGEFSDHSESETASGAFVVLVNPSPALSTDGDADWDIDLSATYISGDGIGSESIIPPSQVSERDFLKVRNRGPKSVKRAVVRSSTRLFIDYEICLIWATDILEKGWFSNRDMETLIEHCEGNGDPKELRVNLQRTLEAEGLELVDAAMQQGVFPCEAKSDVSGDELADAIEAVFTRSTQLPGTGRFRMDKSNELRLLGPMIRANQELQLGMLSCGLAVEAIIDILEQIRQGITDFGSMTVRAITSSQPSDVDTVDFFEAADSLKLWCTNGCVMDGRRRREALEALERLDLSLTFYKEVIKTLEGHDASVEDAAGLYGLISNFEAASERLILEHLPYARRLAARYSKDGEDPEDVFQVAFMGLQRSIHRFDPGRKVRFVGYASYYIRQAISRWRADEGAIIRIPVHRQEKLAKFDAAVEMLDIWANEIVSDEAFAVALECTEEDVRNFRQFPRYAEYPESNDAWDKILLEVEPDDPLDREETNQIVADILAELKGRQADVIRKRFGIGDGEMMSLEEIGRIYGVTRERIRQIEAKALGLLSHPGRMLLLRKMMGM